MPYIDQKARNRLIDLDSVEVLTDAETPGELNYLITIICKSYMDKKGKSYQTINDILGALEGAKAEFYRRVAVHYEQTKLIENGDVY